MPPSARPVFCALLPALAALTPLTLGCSDAVSGSEDVESLYVVPASLDALSEAHFFDHPWPSDLRMEDGSPRCTGYYNPRQIPIIAEYIESTKGLVDGFSPAAAGYVRFTGPIDPGSLPATPTDALSAQASVQLLDIDPASPEHGQHKLISLRWQEAEGVYYQPNTLAYLPTIGFPLRAHTRYALVVTDAIRAKDGKAVHPSEDLSAVLGTGAESDRTRSWKAAVAPALTELEKAGLTKEHIVHLAVFTTADPTKELFAAADDVRNNILAPDARDNDWHLKYKGPTYTEYTGSYGPSPNYQAGDLPFEHYGDGGELNFPDGKPQAVDTFDLRFSLMVPNPQKCPMPENGYPIVLYAHGTGGYYRSYVKDGTGLALAKQCLATMGVDQIFHGTRPGAPPDADESKIELLFFNFQNPVAARSNGRQSALDEVQRARLFTETKMRVPAKVSSTGADILFDPTKVMFFGHSQGGLNGPLYLAASDSARGGVLSGSGAFLTIALLDKTKPSPSVSSLVKTIFLGLNSEEEGEVDTFHPALSLAQTIIDVVDPVHYARHIIEEPRAGFAPKSIYMTEGINADGTGDSYAPPHGIEAHALAMGLPLQIPFQRAIAESQWGGPKAVSIPKDGLGGNLGNGNASGVLAQWAVPPGKDGHFVVFDVTLARNQSSSFLVDLASDPKGRIPPPQP
ncbi:MAG: hypothetical protein U0359_12285 [Byssovorax sp.]